MNITSAINADNFPRRSLFAYRYASKQNPPLQISGYGGR